VTGGRVTRITGALVEAAPLRDVALYELARVGTRGLVAEVIRLRHDVATLQVYEETTGLAVGEPVRATAEALSVELGPGLLGSVLDGVGRPLAALALQGGDYIAAGAEAATLSRQARWRFAPGRAAGDTVAGGDVLGTVTEPGGFVHRILVPPGVRGTVAHLAGGLFTVDDELGRLADGTPLRLAHRWPVRRPRPIAERLASDRPLVTGQRVLDLLFPVAEGGTVAVPGGFGTGKTIIEQSLARHAEADVVVYVGCGERGNEMAEVLHEFPRLADPRTGRSVMDRTVLVVNTSNMPVAAREASVYLGLTIAEYFRDQGLRVAVMTDSLSRWAEALREIGSRLQEMPGEEGYPTYLGNRMAKLFERAGRARAEGTPAREGSVTLISAISPPGGDLSEPVTQAALRVSGALWALDTDLAHQRQFPAVSWDVSWSLYAEAAAPYLARASGADWPALRTAILALMQRERELREIAGLVGQDALQDEDRVLLEVARATRDAVLGQNAYDPHDAASPVARTARLAGLALALHRQALAAVEAGTPLDALGLGDLRRRLAAVRFLEPARFDAGAATVEAAIAALGAGRTATP